ncbi:MAG TPA: hypothetical protein PKK00_12120 [Bacteroidales bacterium]|nr:hypothetical protein [Bacteroidales bacterium]HPS17544.1 hypothetical protein [Bacteroidales bacterium]
MKKIIFASVVAVFISFTFISCGPSSKDAKAYNDALVAQEEQVINAEKELVLALTKNLSASQTDAAYEKLLKQLEKSTDSVKSVKDFNGKSDLKDALMVLFETYKTVVNKDYPEIIKLNKTNDTIITMAEDFDKKIEITDHIDSVLNASIDKFEKVHMEFAKKYRLEFTDKKEQAVTEEKKK